MKIGIINFNSASFTDKMNDFDDLYSINLDVTINEVSYVNETLECLFAEADKLKEIPKTSQPAPKDILEVYSEVKDKYDDIIILTPSPELSGTHQVAVSSLELIDHNEKFHVVNTKSFAISEAIICDRAITLIKEEKNIDEILSDLTELANKITTYIIPGSFDYLKMGGRVNLPKLIIGKLMNLKILVEHKTGIAQVKTTTRGYKKLFQSISDVLNEQDIKGIYSGEISSEKLLYNSFIDVLNKYPLVETKKTSIIMAAHFGPNTLGFAVIEK